MKRPEPSHRSWQMGVTLTLPYTLPFFRTEALTHSVSVSTMETHTHIHTNTLSIEALSSIKHRTPPLSEAEQRTEKQASGLGLSVGEEGQRMGVNNTGLPTPCRQGCSAIWPDGGRVWVFLCAVERAVVGLRHRQHGTWIGVPAKRINY